MASDNLRSTVTKVTSNRVPDDAASKPHHVLSGSGKFLKFRNPYDSWNRMHDGSVLPIVFKLIGLRLSGKLGPMPNPGPHSSTVPVRNPTGTFLPSRSGSSQLRATWLGHACYYTEFPSGLRVLFDPVFEDACSPVAVLGPKRFTPPPCSIAQLPFVDAVVISHSHYDHLSSPTVQEIHKHHPNAHFFVGLGLAKWFHKSGIKNVTELDWWEDAELTLTPATTKDSKSLRLSASDSETQPIRGRFSCLPAQHSSGRTAFDKDTTLWASWAVASGATPQTSKSVFFGGDTGYRAVPESIPSGDDYAPEHQNLPVCPEFAKIGQLRGPFDLGLLPIGAYNPRFLMSSVHANPFDAVEIFRDTKCRKAMGIHWGTWQLTYEETLEPPSLLREALKRRGIPETGVFDVCDIGETREF
ncbi:beta-lactamase superfamily domain-containing protein [Immersiella caudata]|uniref:Beta-lactamase superfamily domain-containing protein n=1 Tax=Immersiella caudata TaxID=314043 RepID=A0AA39WIR3_9PEZI|nr:beta-lactamase superfamily domain-containing protein [Immersiella caudata]